MRKNEEKKRGMVARMRSTTQVNEKVSGVVTTEGGAKAFQLSGTTRRPPHVSSPIIWATEFYLLCLVFYFIEL